MLLVFHTWSHYLWIRVAAGVSECSATLDDSVSEEEEEESSFEELADGTPYLQPGVELSVLNEVTQKPPPNLCLSRFQSLDMFLRCLASALSACLEVILHVGHRLSLHVIVRSCLPVFCAVDNLGPCRVRRGSLGPCDHGGAGAGLQGRRRDPPPGRFPQGLVVGQRRRQGGLVPVQLCEGKWTF